MAAVSAAQAALVAEARARQIAVRELATTLILAVATLERVVIVQIGDGGLCSGQCSGAPFPGDV